MHTAVKKHCTIFFHHFSVLYFGLNKIILLPFFVFCFWLEE
ncbi:hypothetical protein X975_13630, partial [Stegodyphus mimosarum]